MSLYTVTSIPLAAIPGIHSGTGTHQNSNWLVVPSSVPGSSNLQFVGQWVQVTTMLFQLNANVVPNWIGVAIPNGIQDFTKVNIFFHPMPAQAGYKDSDYPTKAGMWPQLFYYMERLGYQLDGAARNQIIIMPFLTNAATNTGIFAANWSDICTDILTAVRSALGQDDGTTLAISQIAVSSYSIGIVYSSNFRMKAPNLNLMTEVWDFDGLFSSSPGLSTSLVSTAQYTAIKYDQNPASGSGSYHVPLGRWADYVAPPKSGTDVHALIRDFMFLHAASVSNVGATIAGGLGPTGSTIAPGTSGTSSSGTTGMSGSTGSPGQQPAAPFQPAPFAPAAPFQPAPRAPAAPFQPAPGIRFPAPIAPPQEPAPPLRQQPGIGFPAPIAPPSREPSPPTPPVTPPITPGLPVNPAIFHPFPPLGPMPIAPPMQPGTPPLLPPSMPPGTPPHQPCECECACCAAITAIVSNVAITASTAIAAITAIAAKAKEEQ